MPALTVLEKVFWFLLFLVFSSTVLALVTKSQLAVDLTCLTMFGLGVWGLVYSLRRMAVSVRSFGWQPVAYDIVNTNIQFVSASKGGRSFNKFIPTFDIEYEFKGILYRRPYDKLNMHLNKIFATPHDAGNYLKTVRTGLYGSKVYVNQKDPSVAFIRRGVTRDQMGAFLFSVILTVTSLLTLFDIIEWQP